MINQKILELTAINDSVYRFCLSFNNAKIPFEAASDYRCRKIKAGKTYELENAVYLAMGLCEELENRAVRMCMEKREAASLYVEEIGLALGDKELEPLEKNSLNTEEIARLIKEYNPSSRIFLTVVLNKGLVLPDSRVVYFNRDNKKLAHSGLIKSVRIKLTS